MSFIRIPKWHVERGFIDPADHERRGAIQDLHSLCDHDGMWNDSMEVFIPSGAALVSERFLVHRWAWSRGKVIKLLEFALGAKMFFTKHETKYGRWISPPDPHCDPHSDPLLDPLADPVSDPLSDPKNKDLNWIFVSKILIPNNDLNSDPKILNTILRSSMIIPPGHLATPEVEEALEKFLQYRRTVLKKPIKSGGPLAKIYREFTPFSASDLVSSIHHSIENEWVGIYPNSIHQKFTKNSAEKIHQNNLELVARYEVEEWGK